MERAADPALIMRARLDYSSPDESAKK